MLRSLSTVIEREGDGYVATCLEFDIVSQGNTAEDARSNLTEAVCLFIEIADGSETNRRRRQ
ncbi:MAG TPA: type II toxin-antitoxin system HicB family antitoxin [Bryobacteraceae bacterium]|nr:type II toxin-antitoxin system HicB family antitoxin [Bryobacteraceae bacterium]